MGKYNFDKIVNRLDKESHKYSENNPNILPMWVADMDFEVFPKITEAIINRTTTPCYGYTSIPDEFFLAYINYWKRHHNAIFKIEDCIFCTGVVAAIDSIFKHHIQKGKKIVLQTPVYHTFFHCIENNGLIAIENQLKYEDGHYSIDFEDLENKLQDKDVGAFLFCNPHNPTGHIFMKEEINKIIEICMKNDVLLISDEIHSEIRETGYTCNSVLSTNINYDKVIVLLAGSKCFNLAGLHSSLVVIKNKELHSTIQDGIYQDDIGEPNYFACDANIVAFNEGDEWLEEMNDYVTINKQYVRDFFKNEELGIKVINGEATYLLWLDVSKYTNNSKEFAEDLKKKTGLWLTCGLGFRGNGKHFVRMNVATSYKNVVDGCNRLKKYIKSL